MSHSPLFGVICIAKCSYCIKKKNTEGHFPLKYTVHTSKVHLQNSRVKIIKYALVLEKKKTKIQ